MKIQISVRDLELTKAQRAKVERRVGLILARYGERIESLKVGFAGPGNDGCSEVAITVRMKPKLVRAADSDTDLFVALDRAAQRAARSVARAIARDGWSDDTNAPAVVTSRIRPLAKLAVRRKRA